MASPPSSSLPRSQYDHVQGPATFGFVKSLRHNRRAQLAMLMEGIDWRILKKTWRPSMVG